MEAALIAAIEKEGRTRSSAAILTTRKKHGFIDSQKHGIEVFRSIDPEAPLIVAEAVWQYSQHILPGLFTHRGPILTVANWSGTWPGLVGMLNLNGSLTKMGVPYSTLWSEDFTDRVFPQGPPRLARRPEKVEHPTPHVRPFDGDDGRGATGKALSPPPAPRKTHHGRLRRGLHGHVQRHHSRRAPQPDRRLQGAPQPVGPLREMLTVSEKEARGLRLVPEKGNRFPVRVERGNRADRGPGLEQCKMYIAAVRIADEFGCATIGIQYQQGLKDLAPASDLVEGLLNNVDRPPVHHEDRRGALRRRALPHFNEVDECAGLDGLVTYRLWRNSAIRRKTPSTICAGDASTRETDRRFSSGFSRSPGRRRRRILSTATGAPAASASRRCISASAAAR
jgi:hypothetical protein